MFAVKVRHGDKAALATDLRDVFRTGQRDYTVGNGMGEVAGSIATKWGKDYRTIKAVLRNNADYKGLRDIPQLCAEIQAMIYTTNWIERLNRDFRRVTHEDSHAQRRIGADPDGRCGNGSQGHLTEPCRT